MSAGAQDDSCGLLFYDHDLLEVGRISPVTPQPGDGDRTTRQPAPRPTRLDHYTADFPEGKLEASAAMGGNGEPQLAYSGGVGAEILSEGMSNAEPRPAMS